MDIECYMEYKAERKGEKDQTVMDADHDKSNGLWFVVKDLRIF